MGDTLLHDCASRLLEVAVDALDSPPDRQFVTASEPVEQCAHVAVWVRELGQATLGTARGGQQPGMPTTRTGQPTARFVVQVMDDCWPVFDVGGDPPAADSITDAAARVLTDRMDVWSALRTEAAAGTLLAALLAHGRDGVEVSAPTTISPQSGGGLMGSRIEVYAHLLRAAESGS